MYNTILLFLVIAIPFYGYSQHHYDRVDIYAIPVYTSFAVDNIGPDYIRAHWEFKFTSTDKDFIKDIAAVFIYDNHNYPSFSSDDLSSTIRLVIDFVSGERVKSFVVMNGAYDFFISKNPGNQYYIQLEGNKLCKVKEVIPFFSYISLQNLKCQ